MLTTSYVKQQHYERIIFILKVRQVIYITSIIYIYVYIYIYPEVRIFFFFLLLEREEGREGSIDAGKKIQLVAPVHAKPGTLCTQTRDGTFNLSMCPDQELNPQHFGYGIMLQPTEPHWPGQWT